MYKNMHESIISSETKLKFKRGFLCSVYQPKHTKNTFNQLNAF